MRSPARLATLSLLISAAFVLAALERLIPSLLPLVKPGLANLFTLVAFALLGPAAGCWVTGGRVLLAALVFGGPLAPSSVLSFAGGAASLAAMVPLVLARGRFSLFGVSLAGAWAHVCGQLLAASALYVRSPGLWRLLPAMGVLALATGFFNAWLASLLVKRLRGS